MYVYICICMYVYIYIYIYIIYYICATSLLSWAIIKLAKNVTK